MKGGAPAFRTPDRHQEARNPDRSLRRSRTPAPAARRVVFHEGADRDLGSPNDPPDRQTSPAADPRRRSKRPPTDRTHMPTIPTPAERARQAALHTGPHQATDGASSSSAPSLPASAAALPPRGQNTADARPRGPAADQQPQQGVGGRTPQSPPPHSARDSTSPGHGHGPPDQPGQCATGLPTLAVMRPNHRDTEDTPQQQGAGSRRPGSGQRNDRGLRPSGVHWPPPSTTTRHLMSPQQEPSTGSVPEGHSDTALGHPFPTGTTPDQDRETMPPPPPRP